MSYQQKSTIFLSTGLLLSFAGYAMIVICRYQSLGLNTENDTKFLAIAFLLFIPVLFVFKFASYLHYLLIENKEIRKEIRTKEDEMDKMIDCKATNASLYTMIFGFFASIGLLILSLPLRAVILGMGLSIVIEGMCGFIIKYVYYTRGV